MAARTLSIVLLSLSALATASCAQGFQSAKDLESAQRSPKDCAKACEDLDLRMSAFVLVEKDVAGCVCEPVSAAPERAPSPPAPAAPAAPPAAAPTPAEPPAAPPPAGEAPQSRLNHSATGATAGYIVVEMRRQASSRQGMRNSDPHY